MQESERAGGAMALASEEKEWARLPGELPPAFRRRHVHFHPSAQRGLCTSGEDGLAAEVGYHGLQENQQAEVGKATGDLFKVIDRLDDVIERLMKSCKVKPDIDLHMDTGALVEESISSRDLEDRLDQIIERLSQSGYFCRVHKQSCSMPLRDNLANEKPACNTIEWASRLSPSKACGMLGNAHDNDQAKTTPTSSFRMPLLTPRCLLSKLGSSEKVDALASPPTSVSRQLSSGRSGRFSAAFSFLVSPRRAGSLSSTSPKPPDMER